jgi:SAM-dependent methyltransferase
MSDPALSFQPTVSSSHSMVRTRDDRSSACFLCHKASNLVVWQEGGYEGRLCSCGMVYTNPKPAPGSIDYTEDNHPETFYSFPADFKASWMARYCPPGRLLEVGSGHGSFLAACRARGYEVSGLEPHPSRARYVEEALGIKVEQAFLEETRLPPGSFDIVYHCDMLAHFPDPVASLHRMAALLRPGGVLFLEVGILGGISPIWYKLIGSLDLGPHLWLYSDRALRLLFTQSKLQIERIEYFGLAPGVIIGKNGGRLIRAIVRLLSAIPRIGTLSLAETVHNLYYRWFFYFLRYRIGAIAPRIGPQTALVVVRPEEYLGSN